MVTCINDQYHIAEHLMRRVRVDVNSVDVYGHSALHWAASSQCASTRVPLIKLLVEITARVAAHENGA